MAGAGTPALPLLRFCLRRLALGVLTLFFVSLLVFVATQALSGDAATAILGKTATPERLAALRAQLHLTDPLWRQYGGWLLGVLQGDLGLSLATGKPVTQLIGERIGNSAFLVLISAVIAIPAALGAGIAAAVRRDRALDHILSTASLVLAALPEFVIGIGLILVLSIGFLHWLPAVSLLADGVPLWRQPQQLALPALTLILAVVPYMSRIMRASMVEVMESDYVQMAELKGLPRRLVILRHAVPNAIVPSIQVVALQLAWLAGGVVVVEYVFRFPGIGQSLVDGVANRDLPVIQALTLLIGGLYVLLNLVADVATILLTPRLKTGLA
ncbi:MAG: ABC transporter permease [Dongiaceae bacterium]